MIATLIAALITGPARPSLIIFGVRGLLFMEVPVSSLVEGPKEGRVIEEVAGVHGAGHDPCLQARRSQCLSCGSGVKEG